MELVKSYDIPTLYFTRKEELQKLSSVINLYATKFNSGINVQIRILSIWSNGNNDIFQPWYTLRSFIWNQGQQGLTHFYMIN